jgi:membrane-bound serine protease (ClpP class)
MIWGSPFVPGVSLGSACFILSVACKIDAIVYGTLQNYFDYRAGQLGDKSRIVDRIDAIMLSMNKRYLLFLLTLLLLLSSALFQPGLAQAENKVFVITLKGPLTPAMVGYLERGLANADSEGAEALVVQLDTPGGSIDLMNRMVQGIRASQIPVVVYVSPRGAIAGSAGTVITLAGHVAAMAPDTAIGAASPVGGQGEDLGETIETKEKEILKATVRSLAEERGEEAIALAEAAIEDAKAASASEAFGAGLIDIIAEDLGDLLDQLNGLQVEAQGEKVLATSGAEVVEIPQRFIEQFLQVLTNPNIVFLLLTIGVQALLIEISSPGGWVAGFIGVVCLALGTYGLGILPVNWFGLAFIATAFVLFILEVKAPTHGALTAAGLASFIVGALVLFNSPETPSFLRVSVPLVIGTGIATAAFFMAILTFAIRAQLRPVEVGREALIGRIGEARTKLSPTGMVHVAGELWTAILEDESTTLMSGEKVEIVGVVGLSVRVRAVTRNH